MLGMRRGSRSAAATIIAGLILSVFPLASAGASHATARNTDDACSGAPEDGFTDTGTEGSVFEEAIDCIAWYGITSGTSATTYSPSRGITRAQMATMIAEKLRQSEKAFAEPGANEDFFTDDNGSVHEDNINFVAEHDVVQGTGPNRFSPDSGVTRAQMATFIVNQLTAIGTPVPAAGTDYFADDDSNVHEDSINRLAALGIATGTSDTTYSPGNVVSRRQMALFLTRDLDYLVEQDDMKPPDERVNITLDKTTVAPGGKLTGTATSGKTIATLKVSGCGLTNQTLTDKSTSADWQFEITIPQNQPNGSCTLSFTATFSDTTTDTRSRSIVVGAEPAPEAVAGSHTGVDVVSANLTGNWVEGETDSQGHAQETFFYDSNDGFVQTDTPSNATISLDEFEKMLTGPVGELAGDVVDVSYAPDPADKSTFTMVTDNVPPVTAVAVSVSDVDHDNAKDDVSISWTASPQPDAVYDVFRDEPTTDNGTIGSEDTQVGSDLTGTSVQVLSQPNGTYNYLVRAESPTSGSMSAVAASDDVTVPGGPPPSMQAANADSDTRITVTYDENVTCDDSSQAANQFTYDADGDPATTNFHPTAIDCGPTSTTTNDAPRPTVVLTFAGGTVDVTAADDTLAYSKATPVGARIKSVSGTEAVDGQQIGVVDTTDPEIVAADATDTTTITLTYSEAVTCDDTGTPPPAADQFAYDNGLQTFVATGIDCPAETDGARTVVLTFTGANIQDSPFDTVTYTEDPQTADAKYRIKDVGGREATSPQAVDVGQL